MGRGRLIAAAIAWAVLVLTWAIFFHGGQVFMCLGPLGVTEASCRAALGLPALTEWDLFMRGWGPIAIVLFAGWVAIAVAARWLRQRGGL